MTRLFDIDLQLVMDTLQFGASIFVLFTILSYLLFNPVRKVLMDRQNRIQNDIDSATEDKAIAAELKAKYKEKLKEIDKEAEQILSEARQKAMKNEARIVDEAKADAARILSRAQEEAQMEKKKVVNEVKQEMITIAALMAAKVVTNSIDTTIQNSMVEETLKEIGDSTWQS